LATGEPLARDVPLLRRSGRASVDIRAGRYVFVDPFCHKEFDNLYDQKIDGVYAVKEGEVVENRNMERSIIPMLIILSVL
jgi:hypothetical protein